MLHSSARKTISDLKKAYQSIASDFSETRQHHWPEFHLFSKHIPDGSKILDLGCGNGRFLRFLQKEEKKVDYTGIDFCPEFLEIARKSFPQQEFIEQDITHLELGKKFERILCVAAFHHIPTRKLRKKTLELLFQHLEDDGTLLLSVWNLWQVKYFKPHFRSWVTTLFSFFSHDPRDLFIPFGTKKVPRYYHAFVPYELRRLLNKAGFVIEHSEVSRHNYLFVCKKKMFSTRSDPLFIPGKELNALRKTSAAALSKSLS